MSVNTTCNLCKGALQVCSDRPSYPVIYSDDLGTVCTDKGVSFDGCVAWTHYTQRPRQLIESSKVAQSHDYKVEASVEATTFLRTLRVLSVYM